MNIKNYTSSVPMLNSIQKIEFRLSQAGATHISKSYENEKPVGMLFQIPVEGIPLTFKLPAKADRVFNYLKSQRRRPPNGKELDTIKAQADRTAWKILSDWIDIQVSIIQLDQAEAVEVFLPYVYDIKKDKTFFEIAKSNSFKLLNQ